MTSYKLVMPEQTNHYGFLFGGNLLKWVDETAWMAVSMDYPTLRFVTIGMNAVEFRKSALCGSILRFDVAMSRIGRTSITYHVTVYKRDLGTEVDDEMFKTEITFVCVNEAGEKMEITSEGAGSKG
ncbi:MAG: hotdog domain-containing protein [bacterium]